MDIKKYLASGILELYVLGRLSDSDKQDVEQNASQYPEIAQEIDKIEIALEALALDISKDVSPEVLDNVLRKIRDQRSGSGTASPAPPATSGAMLPSWLPWTLALLGIAGAGLLWQSNQTKTEQLSTLQEQFITLQEDCDEAASEQESTNNILATLTDPGTKNIILNGTDNAPEKQAVVFYNTTEERALFTASNLPTPPTGKQYQLWAIDAAGPQSLGVLELDLDGNAILPVDFFPEVAAFAITLEDLGGKPAPDLSQLQVIGEVT